jgi:putative thioredoxin
MTVLEVTEATFEQEVLERSHDAPVVVDFWAAWCGPCRALGPILERLAGEAEGAWVLAKVDVDVNPRLATAANVQGIPAVRAFKNGKQVAEFTGAIPEPQVRRWLELLGPSEADRFVESGKVAEAQGNLDRAADHYRRALASEPGHPGAQTALAGVELRRRVDGLEESELRKRIEADATDIDALLGLADIEVERGDVRAGFDRLVQAIRLTAGNDREHIRKRLVELFDTLPPDDARVNEARRALSLALF